MTHDHFRLETRARKRATIFTLVINTGDKIENNLKGKKQIIITYLAPSRGCKRFLSWLIFQEQPDRLSGPADVYVYVDTLDGAGGGSGGNSDAGSSGGGVVVMMLVVVGSTKKCIRVTRLRHWTEWDWLEASLPTTKARWYEPCPSSSRCYRVLRVAAARATTALLVPRPLPLLCMPLYHPSESTQQQPSHEQQRGVAATNIAPSFRCAEGYFQTYTCSRPLLFCIAAHSFALQSWEW